MIIPKNETEQFLLSVTKNCKTLINQTHRKAEETLELKITKLRQIFHFNPAVEVKEDWAVGSNSLEVYNSVFNITERNNKFELHKYPDGKTVSVSYEKVRDEIERVLEITDITATDLQDDIIAHLLLKNLEIK